MGRVGGAAALSALNNVKKPESAESGSKNPRIPSAGQNRPRIPSAGQNRGSFQYTKPKESPMTSNLKKPDTVELNN